MMKRPQVSSHSIPSSSGGAIDMHVFEPYTDTTDAASCPLVIRGTIVLVHPLPALGGGEHTTIGQRRQWWRAVTFALESIPPGGEGRCGGYYQITHTRWGRSWSIGSSRRTAAGPHHRRRRRRWMTAAVTAAATAAATSSYSGRRQPRHGREIMVDWVLETYRCRTPSSSSSLLDDGGGDGGGDIVLLGSSTAAPVPWP